jgi:hypothetical protein
MADNKTLGILIAGLGIGLVYMLTRKKPSSDFVQVQGTTIPGASVQFYRANPFVNAGTSADSNGIYVLHSQLDNIPNLTPGTYTVTVTKMGSATITKTVTLVAGYNTVNLPPDGGGEEDYVQVQGHSNVDFSFYRANPFVNVGASRDADGFYSLHSIYDNLPNFTPGNYALINSISGLTIKTVTLLAGSNTVNVP